MGLPKQKRPILTHIRLPDPYAEFLVVPPRLKVSLSALSLQDKRHGAVPFLDRFAGLQWTAAYNGGSLNGQNSSRHSTFKTRAKPLEHEPDHQRRTF